MLFMTLLARCPRILLGAVTRIIIRRLRSILIQHVLIAGVVRRNLGATWPAGCFLEQAFAHCGESSGRWTGNFKTQIVFHNFFMFSVVLKCVFRFHQVLVDILILVLPAWFDKKARQNMVEKRYPNFESIVAMF